MSYNEQFDRAEMLVKAMLNDKDEDASEFVKTFQLAQLRSFVAGAMVEIPELKERVEKRILTQLEVGEF